MVITNYTILMNNSNALDFSDFVLNTRSKSIDVYLGKGKSKGRFYLSTIRFFKSKIHGKELSFYGKQNRAKMLIEEFGLEKDKNFGNLYGLK